LGQVSQQERELPKLPLIKGEKGKGRDTARKGADYVCEMEKPGEYGLV